MRKEIIRIDLYNLLPRERITLWSLIDKLSTKALELTKEGWEKLEVHQDDLSHVPEIVISGIRKEKP